MAIADRKFPTRLALSLLWWLSIAGQGAASAQPQGDSQDAPAELPIAIAVPRERIDGVEVLTDGRPLDYRVLEPVPWQVALYFDQLLSDPVALRNAAILLGERAERLTSLGPVEILLGGQTVRASLPPSKDADVVSEALAWLRLRESSVDAQTTIRRRFVETMEGEATTEELEQSIAESLRLETEALRVQREGLLLWATGERRPGPRLLVLAGSGHDADAAAFYRSWLAQAGRTGVEVPDVEIRPTLSEVGKSLAVTGWTVVAFAPESDVDALLVGPEQEAAPEQVETPDGRVVQRSVIGFDPRKVLRRKAGGEGADASPPLRLDPGSGLTALAGATAGAVVSDPAVLDGRLEEMKWRSLLAVRTPTLAEPLPIEVRARGLAEAVAAPRWIGYGAPAALSAARARYLASSGETADGDLEVAALVTAGPPQRLAVELSSAGGDSELRPPLRLTVARAGDEGTTIVVQRVLDGEDLVDGRVDLELAGDAGGDPAETPVIVVVDELAGNRWGGTFAGFTAVAADSSSLDGSTLLDLPESAAVRLLTPQETLLVGRVRFAAVLSDARVAQVDFLLDGSPEAVRRTPPYEANLDLGELPRARRVEVVARDSRGEEIGRDSVRINSGNSELSIALRAPDADETGSGGVRADEELWVEAVIDRPQTSGIARVEFFWIDRPIGTLFAPPYRQRVDLRVNSGRGFVRAVVTLSDGSSAEDVLFVNSAGSGDRLQVTLVELLAVVTGPDGRPVADLLEDVFEVREEGEPQSITVFNSADDMPLTVGLAVDSSASMFIKLPKVQLAAMDFLRSLVTERDRGFVIGFGREPNLLASVTSDVARLVRGVETMRPEGFTSIWKGIVYSLVQLQGTPGKKALVVYSDGADEDPEFSYRIARRFARVVGVPIYVILSNNEIVRTEGRGLNVRGFLKRLDDLVSDVGGRVYFTRVGEDLENIYAEIAEELRSQYVLGYYGEQDAEEGWRKIEVDVSIPGLKVRAARGRYP